MFQRLLRLILKELQVTLGDKKARLLLIVPVIMQTLIFPYAATLEVRHAVIAVLDADGSAASTDLIQRLDRTDAFDRVIPVHDDATLQAVLDRQEALLALRIPPDYARTRLQGRTATLQVLLDGRRSNSAQIAAGYLTQILQDQLQEVRQKGGTPSGGATVALRHLYNPNLDFTWHVLPSLVAIITTIGCLMVTALSVAREREEGTFDQLLVSPLTPGYLMAGKAVPGVLIAVFQGSFIALAAVFGYGLPFTGSILVFLAGILAYGLALAGVGLFISSVSATQQQAFLGVFAFMAPAVMLSGYVAPIENMPAFFQLIARINPLSYFIPILKGTFLKHYGWPQALPLLWPLLAIAVGTLGTAWAVFRRQGG